MKMFHISLLLLIWFVLAFHVTQAQSDTVPPTVHQKAIVPSQVDTSEGEQVITVTLQVTDDLSGVAYAQVLFHPTVESTQYLAMNTAGDPNSDTIVLIGRLPQYSAQGVWRLISISTKDNAGNIRYFDPYDEDWPPGDERFINGEYHEIFLPSVAKTNS